MCIPVTDPCWCMVEPTQHCKAIILQLKINFIFLIFLINFFKNDSLQGGILLGLTLVVATEWSESHSVVSDSLRPHRLYSPWNSPGQNTGVGSLSIFRGSSQPRDRIQVYHIAGGFSISWATRWAQKSWSGQPIPPPECLPNPGINPGSPALQVDLLPTDPSGKPWSGWIRTVHPPGEARTRRSLFQEVCCRKQIHVLVKALLLPQVWAVGYAPKSSFQSLSFVN